MKVIIAGSRSITNYTTVLTAIDRAVSSGLVITEVVSGCARGVDRLGEQWATSIGLPVKRFQVEWLRFGKSAGMIRNARMAEYADALIAVWDGKSRGTQNMIDTARETKLIVHVHTEIP